MEKGKEEVNFQKQRCKAEEKAKTYKADEDCDNRVKNSRLKPKFKKCCGFVK